MHDKELSKIRMLLAPVPAGTVALPRRAPARHDVGADAVIEAVVDRAHITAVRRYTHTSGTSRGIRTVWRRGRERRWGGRGRAALPGRARPPIRPGSVTVTEDGERWLPAAREQTPVFYLDEQNLYLVAQHADMVAPRDPATFSSWHANRSKPLDFVGHVAWRRADHVGGSTAEMYPPGSGPPAGAAAAAAPGARLLIIEGVVPDGDEPHLTRAIDLTMLGMMAGKERTEQEYRDLLDSAGFTLDRIVPTPSSFSILEATLRGSPERPVRPRPGRLHRGGDGRGEVRRPRLRAAPGARAPGGRARDPTRM